MLNGASSAGKTSLVRELQRILPQTWLADGIDRLLEMLPPALRDDDAGLKLQRDNVFTVGPELRRAEHAWMAGVARMARDGANIVVDDVFLGGRASQARWRDALTDVPLRFIAVHCAPDVLAARERARGDRFVGTAAGQAAVVHESVAYDFEVDTTFTPCATCAAAIAGYLAENPGASPGVQA